MEDIFITPKDYYWQWSNTCYDSNPCGDINYLKFGEDGYSHQYSFNVKKGYTLHKGQYDDVIVTPEKWSVKKDSTLVWNGFEYKIEYIDHTVIVLTYYLPNDEKQQCSIRLLKVVGEK